MVFMMMLLFMVMIIITVVIVIVFVIVFRALYFLCVCTIFSSNDNGFTADSDSLWIMIHSDNGSLNVRFW